MQSNSEKKSNNNIHELPSINTRYSGRIISKVVAITFGIIILFILVALLIVSVVKIDVTIDATGKLEPESLTLLHSSINGEIRKIYVKSGQTFKAGDLLVQFDSVKLSDQLDELFSKYSIMMIEYEKKSKSLPYEKKQIDFQITKAEAQLLKTKANLRQKINDFFTGANPDSLIRNYKKGSHITMDYALADIISAETEIENLNSQKESFVLKELELKSLLMEISQVKKSIQRHEEYIGRTKLFAPFDGIVLTQNVENLEGTYVNEGSSLFEISKTQNWKVILNVNEKDVYKIKIGDSVKIEIQAMKLDDDYLLIPGKIINISGEPVKDIGSQQSSGIYNVEVEIKTDNAAGYINRFKRGFTINANIIKDRDLIINILIRNIKDIF